MVNKDLDLEMLATYLHLTPPQVERLVSRGKIPGRKVAGSWRFSEAEIHHWMEERIGLAGEEELIGVEGALHRDANSAGASSPSLHHWLRPETVRVPLEARTKGSVVEAMVEIIAETGGLRDVQKMIESVRAREELHSTALDNGVALLHPRRPQASVLTEPMLALGITSNGIPFGGGRLTDVFFLICSTDDRKHLQILARLSRVIGVSELLSRLRQASDSREAYQIVCQAEEEMIN